MYNIMEAYLRKINYNNNRDWFCDCQHTKHNEWKNYMRCELFTLKKLCYDEECLEQYHEYTKLL